MMPRRFIVVPSSPETEALLMQYPGWGRVGRRNGLLVLYVNNKALVEVLEKQAGGEVLGRPGGATKAISEEKVDQLGIEVPRKDEKGDALPPRVGQSVKATTDELVRALVGTAEVDFDW